MISNRLQMIVDRVPSCRCVADIGTDHGYVPVALAKRGDVEHIIGMDVRPGPLKTAAGNIAGLEDRIELRLSDGAEKLKPGEADCIVVAGMGGELMSRIIEAGTPVFRSAKSLVLSPQSELTEFRKYLDENGFEIFDEDMIFEEGKYYFIMQVRYTAEQYKHDECELKYGAHLLSKRDETLKSYILKEKNVLEGLLDKLSQVDSEAAEKRKKQCLSDIELCLCAFKKMGDI